MKAATETLDRTVVKRPLNKQNLFLDKGYDYPEIVRESTQEDTCHISVTEVWRERIDKDRVCNEEMGCCRKNQFVAQQIQKVIINKIRKEIRKLSCTCMFSLLYYCLQENSFGIGS